MMKGYKVFSPNWTCRGFQYEVGKTYTDDRQPICCHRGFHFCKHVLYCFSYYPFNSANKVAEVEALGDIDTNDDEKYCTNEIKIIRELTWHEVLDLANIGKDCTGLGNIGDYNSGDRNTGYYNTGDDNTGYYNTGDDNTGDYNSGSFNSRNFNSGDYNTGYCDSGDHNTGDYNSGDYNTGYYNTGDDNTGDYNSGDHNTGSYNIGNYNIGDWNLASYSSGCFNTEDRPLFFFDRPTNITLQQWHTSEAYKLLSKIVIAPIKWVHYGDMTDKEKSNHPSAETVGGYLKSCDNSDCFIKWWNGLSDAEKDIIKAIPNFNADIFKEITGITVDEIGRD